MHMYSLCNFVAKLHKKKQKVATKCLATTFKHYFLTVFSFSDSIFNVWRGFPIVCFALRYCGRL